MSDKVLTIVAFCTLVPVVVSAIFGLIWLFGHDSVLLNIIAYVFVFSFAIAGSFAVGVEHNGSAE